MEIHRSVSKFVFEATVVVVLFLGMTVTAFNICPKGIVCTNATHFKLCVDHGNGSVYILDKPIACPYNTVCNASQCLDLHSIGPYTPSTRRCSVHGFICTNNYEYQLCKYDHQGFSYPWGPNYQCLQNTICNETYFYHCHSHYTSSYVPVGTGHVPSSTKDECKSKNFVCVDSDTFLLCRDMGDGGYKPYGQQYKCPKTHVCHKSSDKPCGILKAAGSNLYFNTFFSILLPVSSGLLINYT